MSVAVGAKAPGTSSTAPGPQGVALRLLDTGFAGMQAAGRVLGKGPNAAQRAAVLAVSGLVGMAEVNKILASVRLPNNADTSAVYGFTPWKAGEAIAGWATVSATVPIRAWVGWHAACDLLFIAGYAVLLARSYPPAHRKRVRFGRWLMALVVIDLVEDALGVATAHRLPDQLTPQNYTFSGGVWLRALPWATGIKWVLTAVVVVSFLYAWWQETQRFTPPTSGAITRRWSGLWIAVKMQRFSALLVVILAVFLLAPGGDLLDQIPDIERTWLLSGWDGQAITHGLLAAASAVLLWLTLWCLGRTRTVRAYLAYELGQAQPRHNRPLSVAAAVAGYLALALALDRGGWAQVEWTTVWITAGVLLAIPIGSVLTRGIKIPADYPVWPIAPGVWITVLRLGDRFAVWSFALFWLSLFRSSVGPLMLETAATAIPLALIAPLGLGVACWVVGIVGHQREISTRRLSHTAGSDMHGAVQVIRAAVRHAIAVAGYIGRWMRRTARSRRTLVAIARWAGDVTAAPRRWLAAANNWMDGPPTPAPLPPPQPDTTPTPESPLSPTEPPAADEEPGSSVPASPVNRPGSPLHPATQQYLRAAGVIMAAVAASLLAVFLFNPIGASSTVGALAVLICGFLILASLYTATTLMVQIYRPARVFRIVGIRATPVITVLLILGVLVPQLQRSDALHTARRAAPDAAAAAAAAQWAAGDITADLTAWMNSTGDGSTADCAIPIPIPIPTAAPALISTARVMPLAIVGAAGGGARAAWWTVAAMTHLKNSPCAAHSVFLASGASGGSMGLATMLAADDPVTAARTLVTPAALSAAVDGLVIRDTIAGFSGLNLAAAHAPTDAPYPDRSVLMEAVWSQQIPTFTQPFPLRPFGTAADGGRQPANVAWHTLFNTTSAISGCKVLVSDVDLRPADQRTTSPQQPGNVQTGSASAASPGGATATSCGDVDDPLPATSNLYASNPCQQGMPLVTAALMSSRFPFVTPSGVVGADDSDCGPRDQLIDGGYSENSAIGTAADVLELLMPAVRAHNAQQLTVHPTQPTLVVPVVISVENKPRPVIGGTADTSRTSETFVPLIAGLRKNERLYDTVAQLERALAMTEDWCGAKDCDALKATVNTALDRRAVVVAPYRAPQVIAPLGWVLSPATRDSLDYSMRANLECNSGMPPPADVPALNDDDCPPITGGAFGRYLLHLRAQDPP